MGEYTNFINEIKGADYRGTNFIEYNDKGGEIYISFQVLLRFLNEFVNLNSNGKSIIKIDWKKDKPFYAFSTTISSNLLKCYVYNDYVGTVQGGITDGGVATFQSFTTFSETNISKIQETLKKEAGSPTDKSIYPTIGNINYIYLNTGYVAELVTKESNNADNKLSVKKLLQTICDDVNKALGSVNDFQAIIDDDENELTIIDFNQKRIKGLSAPESTLTTIKAQGLGSFVTSINAQSSITPEIATMISVGAQKDGNVLGEEATSLSKLSIGLTDRIYPEKEVANSPKVNKLSKDDTTAFQQTIESYKQLILNQINVKGTTGGKISFKSDDKANVENIPVELYRACLGKFTTTNQSSTSFIPIKLDFTISGISGIKIFQKFNLTSDVLPYIYNNNFNFIVTGISHEINNSNKWSTKISSLITIKDLPVTSSNTFSIPLSLEDEESSVTPSSNTNTTSYTPENIPANVKLCKALPGELNEDIVTSKIVSSYGSKVQGKKSFIAKLEKAYDVLLKQGIKLEIGDNLRSYDVQKAAYLQNVADKKAGKSVPNKAHPCNGYHVRGQAIDLAQTLDQLDDITSHGKIYKALYDAGLRRIVGEWWHWSIGESNHEINKKFPGNKTSRADKDNFTKY